ncbi:hypothetical protein IW261DRAFT_251749 [Armillaria novae-zelandiae]|uniref:Heterokaryon incompatibility domain-containing protein n=1 Tax=Armillaria novae-zelandiae TaxID=153914 RepID=A0AA39P6E4_9AGAR|nr:hypothetical protein IW261DRAFT_251749 [Armillaria novae-zelandiae]
MASMMDIENFGDGWKRLLLREDLENNDCVRKQVTLTALTEIGQEESSIPVLKQRSYTGTKPVISSPLANTPCAELGTDGFLRKLNELLDTSYSVNTLFSRNASLKPETPARQNLTHLSWILEPYIEQNYDFGTAYAQLRRYWSDVTCMESNLCTREAADCEMRRKALVGDRINKWNVPPRRVWDLCANRVVPYWVADRDMPNLDKPTRGRLERPWGISHAWMSDEERADIWTPINGYQWPVPVPKDAKLELIRIEMLNLGAEYVWLDVLCLRQAGGQDGHLGIEEWKLDVPTIGWVYRDTSVMCYFSGLGRPLSLKPGDFESDRCWFNRAWTLQEISEEAIIGGETGDNSIMEKEIRAKFQKELESLRLMRKDNSVVDVLRQMQTRVSTNPTDRVAGLACLLDSRYIPVYDASQPQEDAWVALVDAMAYWSRTDLFFLYPEPGNGNKYWRPSWEQMMKKMNFQSCSGLGWLAKVGRTEETNIDWFEGPCIDSGHVRGLDYEGEGPRQGDLIVGDFNGTRHTFKIFADHQYPIPDGSYILIGTRGWDNETFWAVGIPRQDGIFEKVSVFSMPDIQQLCALGVVRWAAQMGLC